MLSVSKNSVCFDQIWGCKIPLPSITKGKTKKSFQYKWQVIVELHKSGYGYKNIYTQAVQNTTKYSQGHNKLKRKLYKNDTS